MTQILLVGAADTGRAPMAAALLERQIKQRQLEWGVASAGVLGHDGDPPEIEARTAMGHLGYTIEDHRARSVTDELVAAATLVIAIDSGTSKALHARFPSATHIHSLGELAGKQRDIPDPFRMQVGAWMTYARELDSLLEQALARISELAGDEGQGEGEKGRRGERESASEEQRATDNGRRTTDERTNALARIRRLLTILEEMPEVVDWPAARGRIERELAAASAPLEALDLAAAYSGLLRAALALSTPTVGQSNALRTAFTRLERPITQDDLTWLSIQIGAWAKL